MAIYISSTMFYLLLSLAHDAHAASWSNVTAEVEKVTKIYQGKTGVIPLQNLSETLNVSLGLHLLAINNFDDAAGIIDINTYLSVEWKEEIYLNAYGGEAPDMSVTISAASIWKPSLILVNSAEEDTKIVQEQSQVRIHLKSGKCEWNENIVFKASCKPDLYFYPFDIHDCSVTLTTRVYTSSELTLIVSSFRKDYFEKSVAWSVKRLSAETFYQDSKSYVKFQITIGRKSTNYVMNYILPIVILSFLNLFVFVLPRKSGERAGYSVTCFLALVVLMNTIVTPLSRGSIFVYYITGVMISSALIIVVVCFTLIIHKKVGKEDTKNRFCFCYCTSDSVDPKNDEEHGRPPSCLQKLTCIVRFVFCMLPKDSMELRWVHVANALDLLFFVLFFVIQFLYSVAYISCMSLQYSEKIEKLALGRVNT